MKLIFLGPPGAGKGTQAARIAAEHQVAHISTGDMLRAEIRGGTPLGVEAKSLIDRGELVPDDVILAMVRERIQQPDCAEGFLFDGFPRTIAQAEALALLCGIDCVVNIDVPDERLIDRISGRRMCPVLPRYPEPRTPREYSSLTTDTRFSRGHRREAGARICQHSPDYPRNSPHCHRPFVSVQRPAESAHPRSGHNPAFQQT